MKRIWAFFASVKLTVGLAAIICVVAAYGSIAAVRHPEFYGALDRLVLFPWLFRSGFTYLNLTLWLYALIMLTTLFAINTAVCTVDKIYNIVKTKLPIQSFYPQIVHVGFLVAILGHLAGSVWGFKTYGNVLIKGAVAPVPRMEGLSMRLDGLETSQTPNGELTSVKTRITLIKDSKEILTDDIGINSPLLYKGAAFYHAGQGLTPTGIALEADGVKFETAFYAKFKTRAGAEYTLGEIFPDFRLDEKGNPYSASKEFVNPHVEIIPAGAKKKSPSSRTYLDMSRPGNSVTIDGRAIRLAGYVETEYVSLNIAKDPGIRLIISGSAILVIGMLLLLFLRGERTELMAQEKFS
ncbi:MAG: cytochrome c biogenesis protein ResB [Deltaproteobacteria bacterium]|nr:cytochrome c biogenesis protein ResB [Deltaproteobacteria bacterium]